MNDPMTQVRSIPNPFLPKRHGYRPPIITIWHVDPETDGTDDSCDWFGRKPTKRQQEALRWLAKDEAREPWFTAHVGKRIDDPVKAEALARGAYLMTALTMRVDVTIDEAEREANRLIHNPMDNCRSLFAYQSGYHGNDDRDDYWREEHAYDLFRVMAGAIIRNHRPWYRHPRWHIHHWEIQVHPVQHFKRWTFSRCTKCGGRFRWGESPVGPWSGDGPRWFKPEPGVHHMHCGGGPSEAKAA